MEQRSQQFRPTDRIRTPAIANEVSTYIKDIEGATPDSPVSIDQMCPGGSFLQAHKEELNMVDALYERHLKLFSEIEYVNSTIGDPAHESVYDLTKDILNEVVMHQKRHRGALLALGIVQIAEACTRIAADPISLEMRNPGTIEPELADVLGKIVAVGYSEVFSKRIKGDVRLLPTSRMNYSGHIADMHYGFWTNSVVQQSISPEMYERSQKLLPKFPAKIRLYDMHTFFGRVDMPTARERFLRGIDRYEQSLSDVASESFAMSNNVSDISGAVFETLDAAVRKGYDPNKCLQVAVRNGSRIGDISRETANGPIVSLNMGIYDIDDSDLLNISKLNSSHYCPEKYSDKTAERLIRNDANAGICPARYHVRLTTNGETHSKLQTLSSAIEEFVGVTPSFIQEKNDETYLDAASMMANFVLLGIAEAYKGATH